MGGGGGKGGMVLASTSTPAPRSLSPSKPQPPMPAKVPLGEAGSLRSSVGPASPTTRLVSRLLAALAGQGSAGAGAFSSSGMRLR